MRDLIKILFSQNIGIDIDKRELLKFFANDPTFMKSYFSKDMYDQMSSKPSTIDDIIDQAFATTKPDKLKINFEGD